MAFRLDNGGALRSKRVTVDGAVRYDAVLTRTGVFTYSDGVKTWREYRPPEEVFNPESMASFGLVPVTDDHPPEFVTPTNAAKYKCGRVSEDICRDGNDMIGSLIVESSDLLAKMDAGKLEVSNGYECVIVWVPGVSPEGEPYDGIQTKIVGNHAAVVDRGRAGNARVRADALSMRMDSAIQVNDSTAGMVPRSEKKMAPRAQRKDNAMTIEEALAQLTAALKENGALTAAKAAAEEEAKDAEAEAAAAEEKAKAEEEKAKNADAARVRAEAERDSLKAKLDTAEKSLTDEKKARADGETKAVKSRVDLVTKAAAAGVDKIKRKVDGKDAEVALLDADDTEIRLATIAKLDGSEVAAEKRGDAAYVEARFDFSYEAFRKSGKAFASLNAIVNAPVKNNDQAPAPVNPVGPSSREAEARKKMINDSANAYKEGKE